MAFTRCVILLLCCALMLSQIANAQFGRPPTGKEESKVAAIDVVNPAPLLRRLLQYYGMQEPDVQKKGLLRQGRRGGGGRAGRTGRRLLQYYGMQEPDVQKKGLRRQGGGARGGGEFGAN
ncbi:hypothetical protein CAPTEDRAFT_214209 [Capitella teleta]|uniref:Uncharacterized protein n=1 Tax=Capitella teleta TaxID=283909 RepID=R7VGC1_CAPTE|nr:hypothetical protein CAPTEDRAFT_214940 [Capitella teleta]ELU17893.1 hypothetical protein CAPTEDRAFT_214209 [Capitella teleta]|eukprot:ELU06992.1 hypothetical protein CAPTEDRAFT_214940 [Capitella teleta]